MFLGVWVHIEGATSPSFTHDGHVSGTDSKNTLISDLRQYIRYAAQHNILVFPTLWNGALEQVKLYLLCSRTILPVGDTKLKQHCITVDSKSGAGCSKHCYLNVKLVKRSTR